MTTRGDGSERELRGPPRRRKRETREVGLGRQDSRAADADPEEMRSWAVTDERSGYAREVYDEGSRGRDPTIPDYVMRDFEGNQGPV